MHFIREAGWPDWFVFAIGTFALWSALRYSLGDHREALGDAVGGAVATLLAGLGGTVLGVQLSFAGLRALPDPSGQHWIAFVGVKESLYNLDVALAFALAVTLVVVVGRRRGLDRVDAVASRP
jgi:hypothetical protein